VHGGYRRACRIGIDPVSAALTQQGESWTLPGVGGIGLLGPLRVDGAESLEPRDRVALGVLAVRRGRVVAPDEFADALWGGDLPSSWPKQVQIRVGRLRKALGPATIETVDGGYRLRMAADEVDADRFEELIEQGRRLMVAGDADRAAAALARAMAMWRGSPLQELDGWLPARSEAVRLEELHRTAQEDWLDARLAAGEHRAVAAEAEALVTAEPLRERRWAALALAQYRCGRQADALRSLSRARRTLAEQAGLDPTTALVELEAAILRQDGGLADVAEPVPASDDCPYKGLTYYDSGDAADFGGRHADVEACLDRLRSTSLLVIAGPSGCGKSSLVRAGLVPALEARGQVPVVMVPGYDPDVAMTDALAREHVPLLVIDQFEEVFTLGQPADAVQAFCRRVAEYGRCVAPVVIAVRSDHVGGLGIDPGLSRLAEQGLHLVNPLAGDELREAIELPAARAGLRLESGLVDVLVRDCEGEPGALPLLSHALVETWRRRDGVVLTLEGYRSSGGIRVAVARSADRLHDSLPAEQRHTLRSVLLRLVTPALDGEPVRCRVPSRILLDDPGRERVVAMLVRARLVTCEADTFELAHEALARAWPRLQAWLDEDAAGQRIMRHLATATDGWDTLGRPASELYRGARLEAALEWRDATHPDLTTTEREFLDTSAEQAAAETRELAERARRDARQNRRLRGLLVAAGCLLVAALVAGALALAGRRDAREQRDAALAAEGIAERERQAASEQRDAARIAQSVAEQEGRIAVARELAAAADGNVDIDGERAVLLALAAVDHTRAVDGSVLPEAEAALHRAMAANRLQRRLPDLGVVVDWSPAGTTVAAATRDEPGSVVLVDADTGAMVRTISAHDSDVTDIAFNSDGTLLATTGHDGAAHVWNTATGELVHTVEGSGGSRAIGPSFSGDSALLAIAWPDEGDGVVRVVDLGTGQVVTETTPVPSPYATSFDPRGSRLVVASGSAPVAVVVDAGSGEPRYSLEGHRTGLRDVAWSPDGSRIATTGSDGGGKVFDAETGAQQTALSGQVSALQSVDWSSDSMRIVATSDDGSARVWGLLGGESVLLLTLSASDTRLGLTSGAFSPDGSRLITADIGMTSAVIWDVGVTGGTEVAGLPAVGIMPGEADYSTTGQLILPAGGGAAAIWDPDTATLVEAVAGRSTPGLTAIPGVSLLTGDDFDQIAADPLGQLVALTRVGVAQRVEVFDLETGDVRFAVRTSAEWPHFAWTADGAGLAVSDGAVGRLTVVDRDGATMSELEVDTGWVGFVATGDDPDLVVVTVEGGGDAPGRVLVWNWRTGTVEESFNTSPDLAVPSPDGELIAVKPAVETGSQIVEIWDNRSDRIVARLTGQSAFIEDIAFHPDGSVVATSHEDGTIRLWDPRTGGQRLLLDGHPYLTKGIVFSPDGAHLASYGVEGVVRVWALGIDELTSIARARVTRTFTDDECRQYLHTERCADPREAPSATD
jgi:WD40 repeat protein/DNA-binding SARP family transcriptional activator